MRHTLVSVRRAHYQRVENRQIIQAGGESIAKEAMRGDTRENLNYTDAGGTIHHVFVFGADNPDSTDPVYYIP